LRDAEAEVFTRTTTSTIETSRASISGPEYTHERGESASSRVEGHGAAGLRGEAVPQSVGALSVTIAVAHGPTAACSDSVLVKGVTIGRLRELHGCCATKVGGKRTDTLLSSVTSAVGTTSTASSSTSVVSALLVEAIKSGALRAQGMRVAQKSSTTSRGGQVATHFLGLTLGEIALASVVSIVHDVGVHDRVSTSLNRCHIESTLATGATKALNVVETINISIRSIVVGEIVISIGVGRITLVTGKSVRKTQPMSGFVSKCGTHVRRRAHLGIIHHAIVQSGGTIREIGETGGRARNSAGVDVVVQIRVPIVHTTTRGVEHVRGSRCATRASERALNILDTVEGCAIRSFRGQLETNVQVVTRGNHVSPDIGVGVKGVTTMEPIVQVGHFQLNGLARESGGRNGGVIKDVPHHSNSEFGGSLFEVHAAGTNFLLNTASELMVNDAVVALIQVSLHDMVMVTVG